MAEDKPSRREFFKRTSKAAASSGLAGLATRPEAAAAEPDSCGSVWERPPSQVGNNLNLILLVSDTFRADNLECYGSQWIECPNLNRFANDCIIFQDAYPEGLPTIPVRRTLLTGRRILPFYYHRQHEPVQLPGWHELYNEDVTLSETLHEAGYLTALIADNPHYQRPGKNFHRGYYHYEWIRGQEVDYYGTAPRNSPDASDMFPASYLNLPELGQGFKVFLRQYKANRQRWLKDGDSLAEQVSKKAISWLKENHSQRPFFLHVDAFDPHEPWDPPRHFLDRYVPNAKGHSWPEPPYADVKVPEEGVKRLRANYAGEATCVDHWFGQILDTVSALGLFDHSVVVFMSDHGALLGEQGQFAKGPRRLRTQVTHIPLLIRMPNKEFAGKRIKGYVQIPDIMPTLLGRLKLKPPSRVTGQDVWPLVTGETESWRDHVVHAYGWIAAVRTPEWTFSKVWKPDKLASSPTSRVYETPAEAPYTPQLYDTRKDPQELTNVAERHPDIVAQLGRKIDEYLASGEGITRGYFNQKAGL